MVPFRPYLTNEIQAGSKGRPISPVLCVGRSGKEQCKALRSILEGGPSRLINERMGEYTLHLHSDLVLFDMNFWRRRERRYLQKYCKILVYSVLLVTDIQNNVLNLSAIFINNLAANVIMFYKYIILDFYNPKLRWKIRRLITPKVRCSTRKSLKNQWCELSIKNNPYI